MFRPKAVFGVILMTIATAANAQDATLAKAVATYNELPTRARVLAVAPTAVTPGTRITRLPEWLAQAGLTAQEAAATAAAFGVYGEKYMLNYQSQRWATAAKIAGYAAEVFAGQTEGLPPALPNEAPSRELTEARRTALIRTLRDMGSCSGALVRAANKAAGLRAGDDATLLLAKARRDLGATALPPDDSCLA